MAGLLAAMTGGPPARMVSAGTPGYLGRALSGGYSITLALSSSKPTVQDLTYSSVVQILGDEDVHEAVQEAPRPLPTLMLHSACPGVFG
jgi:hypothetical protein